MNDTYKQWCLQEDVQKWIACWGQETWLQLYKEGTYTGTDGSENRFIWSFLIDKSSVSDELQNYTFEQFDGYPFTDTFEKDGKQVFYTRFGYDDREPIIFRRSFPTKERYLEISQEFIHFFELYHDLQSNNYILEHDDGREEVVIKVTGNSEIFVRTHRIRQFLAFKDMALVVGMSNMRHFNTPIGDDFEPGNSSAVIKPQNEELHYALWYQPSHGKTVFFTEILGKKIIYGMPIENTGLFPFKAEKRYESFEIGIDENGTVIENTCNPETLANYFGANPDSPHYITPVYFSKDVLTKYYNDTTKYEVRDGSIVIGSYMVRADTNHSDYVIVFLGDLGRDMPYNEQKYWKSFNILPEGKMSTTAFRRSFLGEWADPEAEQFVFLQKYEQLQESFHKKNEWNFIKPLTKNDKYRLFALRIPGSDRQQEFDQMVEHLNIILIESMNEKVFNRLLGKAGFSDEIKNKRSIKKLELLCVYRDYAQYEQHIEFLGFLNWLRNKGASHRKGSEEYLKVRDFFQIDEKGYALVFQEIMKQAIAFLEFILEISEDDFLKMANGAA